MLSETMPNKQISHSHALCFTIGAFVGAAAFLILFGLSPLDVTNDVFLRGGFIEKDCIQHYTGWLFYRNAPISYPFCIAPGINWPEGISIAYTDSIPLFAVIFRLLNPILPATFQYFGLFVFLSFCLQGGFAALLLSLFLPFTAALIGCIPFVFSPILIERAFRHTSLTAHFLILWALYEYFKPKESKGLFRGGFLACCMLSIAIHPYLAALVLAIALADSLDTAFAKKCVHPLISLLICIAGTLFSAYSFGFASGTASGGSDVEYGYFSMNLNALWNPISRWATVWSLILPVQNQVGGNYDAFNYLGLGILLALIVTIGSFVLHNGKDFPSKIINFCSSHLFLILMCICCTMFAITNTVTANGATLFSLNLPHPLIRLFTMFRSSGRMFWPVYYLIFLWCIVQLAALFSAKIGLISLAVLCVFQLWDISPALMERSAEMHNYTPEYVNPLTDSFWANAAAQYDHIFSLDGLQAEPLHLALYAAERGMTTNDPFAARYNEDELNKRRGEEINNIKEGTLDNSSLYLIRDEGLFWDLAEYAQDKAFCARVGEEWYVIAPDFHGSADASLPFGDDYPLHVYDYSDDNWLHGVLLWDNQTLIFPDCAFTRSRLENAKALSCDEGSYSITKFDDHDKGWLMVTLDIDDAAILINKDLH